MSLIDVSTEGGAAIVRLNRPEKRNALSRQMLADFCAIFDELSTDKSLEVVTLLGNGPVFSAGADVSDLASLDTPENAEIFISELSAAISAVRDCPVPVIAAMHGVCVGGALELAAGSDLRIASEDTVFSMPEVLVGIPSVIEAALLPALIGRGRTARLVMTGEQIDAATAHAWGLIEEIVPAGFVEMAAKELASTLQKADPAAVRAQKKLMAEWDELGPMAAVQAGISAFGRSFENGTPARLKEAAAKLKKG